MPRFSKLEDACDGVEDEMEQTVRKLERIASSVVQVSSVDESDSSSNSGSEHDAHVLEILGSYTVDGYASKWVVRQNPDRDFRSRFDPKRSITCVFLCQCGCGK